MNIPNKVRILYKEYNVEEKEPLHDSNTDLYGFFIGIPIKLSVGEGHDDVKKYAEFLDQYNNQDDSHAELSKICSIYGKGF